MTGIDWLAVFILAVMVLCQVEELENAYRERTEAMLRIAGIMEPNEESHLMTWVKKHISPSNKDSEK
jgi:hypothetical protein